MDLSHDFAVYGIVHERILLFSEANRKSVYFLHRIPKVDTHFLGVRQMNGNLLGALIPKGDLEKAVDSHSLTTHRTSEHGSLNITHEQPLNPETVKELVYLARGYHPPERISFHDHPFPSTLDSDLSGM